MRRKPQAAGSVDRGREGDSLSARVFQLAGMLAVAVVVSLVPAAAVRAVAVPVPVVASSPTLRSPLAAEAVAQHSGIIRPLDGEESHSLTVRPPAPVFDDPSGDPSVVHPVLSDQFAVDYYTGELPPPPPPTPALSSPRPGRDPAPARVAVLVVDHLHLGAEAVDCVDHLPRLVVDRGQRAGGVGDGADKRFMW